jgi:hypothetical protein
MRVRWLVLDPLSSLLPFSVLINKHRADYPPHMMMLMLPIPASALFFCLQKGGVRSRRKNILRNEVP